jgi:precorrin-8X/cobalt-precorrin-8 methylmutase
MNYVRDGAAIYRESFSIIRKETDLKGLEPELARVIVRMIHACGMTDLRRDVQASPDAASAGISALLSGAPIFCDTMMVASGITRSRLPRNNDVICTLNDSHTAALAEELKTTRTAASVELWRDRLEGSVVVIGNAPTALFHLLEMIASGAQRPALIVGIPVGFVGAAESKEALVANSLALPYLTVRGRRGGSAIASAAINALANENE